MGLFATSQTRAFGHAKRKSRASKRHYIFLVLGAMFALACVSQRLGFGTVGELMRGEASGSGGTGGRRLLSGAAPCRTFPQWMEDGGWVVYAIGILYLFLGIAIICDDYFTASLELICTKLNLSEDVAGATFMAAGSSAPELFTSTMSLVSEQATNELGVATIVGSAVFNILIIIAATVIFAGKSLQLDWKPVTRDCMFYGLAIVYVLFIMSDGKVWWWEGLIAVVLYFVYVAFMVINERFMTWVDKMVSRKVKDVSAAEDEEGGASNGNGKEGKEGKEGEEEEKKDIPGGGGAAESRVAALGGETGASSSQPAPGSTLLLPASPPAGCFVARGPHAALLPHVLMCPLTLLQDEVYTVYLRLKGRR
mmetsp:Transcript_5564/g.14112  ORF Transcript_5564/g.14112 Transcript_5564/m.14112 type:complete len:366 (-) Transcript_5564:100-1197(-)